MACVVFRIINVGFYISFSSFPLLDEREARVASHGEKMDAERGA